MIKKSGLDAYNAEAEKIRRAINSRPLTDFYPLVESKHGGYNCPICGSGTKGKGTGALHIRKTDNRVTCFTGCFGSGDKQGTDTLGALRVLWPELKEKEIFEKCGMPMTGNQKRDRNEHITQQTTHNTEYTTQKKEPSEDYTAFFLQANKDITKTTYHRGITLDTLNRFKVGYVERWRHPKVGGNVPATPRLIIPSSKSSYLARDTRESIPEEQEDYKKSKVGQVHIFNLKTIATSTKPIFIVEGEIDALSIIDVGGEALGLGGTGKAGDLLNYIKVHKPARPLIIARDKDVAGQKCAEALQNGLYEMGIPFYRKDITGTHKDANEALMADREAFKAAVEKALAEVEQAEQEQLEELRAEYRKNSTLNYLQSFIDGIADSVNTPVISTGFPMLDEALDGGFYEGLHIIGGISSLGKTSLCLQIADNIAAAGNDVMIFSLEMARTELMAKSVSRLTAINAEKEGLPLNNAKTARGITCYSRWGKYSAAEKKLIRDSIEAYGGYAGNVFMFEGIGDIGVMQIREAVNKHFSITGRRPVVLVDYLQILAPVDVRLSDKQAVDKSVLELKRISRDFKIPVLAVSSLNRENYKEEISARAYKESGAIEYGSDVLIGLQLQGTGEKDFDVDKAISRDPRQIELRILKNRGGKPRGNVKLNFYPAFNYFVEKEIGADYFGGKEMKDEDVWTPLGDDKAKLHSVIRQGRKLQNK